MYLNLWLIQHFTIAGHQPITSVNFPSACTYAERVFLVPCTSAPNPSRFPKTCVYHQEILTIPGVDMGVQLIVFWSKALLRQAQARSSLEEMTTGTAFQRYIPDPHPDNLAPPNEVRRHILCTGMYSKTGTTTVNTF